MQVQDRLTRCKIALLLCCRIDMSILPVSESRKKPAEFSL